MSSPPPPRPPVAAETLAILVVGVNYILPLKQRALLLPDTKLLLSERRCSADIYPHQWYHQVINTTLVTIVVGKMPDYPWIGRGEPTHGGGESPSY